MTDKRISELPSAGPLNGDEMLPVVQAGETRRMTAAALREGLLPVSGGTVSGPTSFSGGLTVPAGADLDGGTIDGTAIGAAVPASGRFTTLRASDSATVATAAEFGLQARLSSNLSTNRGFIVAQRSRGSLSLPAPVQSGDFLGGLGVGGHDGGQWTYGWNGGAEIYGVATEAWTATAHGTALVAGLVPNGQSAVREAARLTSGALLPGSDGTINLGATYKRWNDVYAVNAVIQTSDEEQKRDIAPCALGMDFVLALQPIEYRWRDVVEAEVTETRVERRQRMERTSVQREDVQLVDGLWRRVLVEEEQLRPVCETVPLHDADGNPLLDSAGAPVTQAVPVFDEVEVETVVQPAVQRLHHRLHTGFGARQVRNAVEKTGQDYACVIHDSESGCYGLRYQELMAPLVRAIQQLHERVAALESPPYP
ncbi:tail fiber domain-containing protein [Azospirillum sp. B506]|uniref:tail fiber domain-containing protein n=1 Tax=Azospirillum sp. B506 TaxID=137721 RepID=UPI00034511DF|nr:tail fiber domain-containing protein [Azospirillum sp. B506]